MTSTDLLALDKALNDRIISGDALAAFEDFYADKVTMQENDAEPTVGKDANRLREQAFFDAITEFRSASVLSHAAHGNTTFSQWAMDYTHKAWGSRTYTQVAVRTWEGDKIVKEVFYYG